MEGLESFVITLVTTLIFMTAVELIAPDNGFKKYVKFVLGLILVAVILNPIVSILSQGEKNITNMIDEFSNADETMAMDEETKNKQKEMQVKAFKDNFNKNVLSILKKEFPKMGFEVDIDCKVDLKNINIEINKVKVTMEDGSIKKVKKVEIGDGEQKKEGYTEKEKEVREYLSKELGVEKEKIVINNKG